MKIKMQVFIWSAAMCFIFVAPINTIFMRPLYEADIQCDCIINSVIHVRKYRNQICVSTLRPSTPSIKIILCTKVCYLTQTTFAKFLWGSRVIFSPQTCISSVLDFFSVDISFPNNQAISRVASWL